MSDRPVDEVRFIARGAIRSLFRSRDPEVLLEGPAGTGKTMGLCTYADWFAWEYPGSRILFVRATRASMTQSVLVTYEGKVLLPEWGITGGARRDNRSAYRYPNGSEVVIGGLDNPDRIMSTEYDLICVFEATETTEDGHEKLTSRLRNNVAPYQQIVCDCNPSAPTHWLNQRAAQGRMRRLLSRHQDNPALWQDGDWTDLGRQYIARLQCLSGVRRKRLYDGVWTQAEGLVYDNWDPARHVIEEMPEGWELWPHYRSIDFGYTNPFVCQWWAVDPDGRMYLYRENYRSRRLVAEWGRILNGYGDRITDSVADHDAEDRATLEAAGIDTIAARKEVLAGIQAMTSRLELQSDRQPRLYVLRDAMQSADSDRRAAGMPCGFLEEIESYRWQEVKGGKIKEEPVKEHDHSMDAARYMVMHLDGVGESAGYASIDISGRFRIGANWDGGD